MDALSLVAMGKIKRLIIEMPPRHSKTELSSVQFSSWMLARDPRLRVVLASYSRELAILNSRRIRDNFRSGAFAGAFPHVSINDEKGSEREWETNFGGGVLAVGVGSGLTGRGADVMIIDDPVKDAEEARSLTTLEAIWQWYVTVARTRLQPNASIIIPMTRWSEFDLVGRLLLHAQDNPNAERWYRLRLPAVAEDNDLLGRAPGEALWPDAYGLNDLLAIKALDERLFSALYQQNPRSDDDIRFRRSDLKIVAGVRYGQVVRSWDLAVTENDSSDWCVGALVYGERVELDASQEKIMLDARLPLPYRLHVADVVRNRGSFPAQRQHILETAFKDGLGVPIVLEKVRMDLGSIQQLTRDLQDLGFVVHHVTPRGDKISRKGNLEAAARMGQLSIEPASWTETLVKEFEYFPAWSHDDQVDAVEQALLYFGKRSVLVEVF